MKFRFWLRRFRLWSWWTFGYSWGGIGPCPRCDNLYCGTTVTPCWKMDEMVEDILEDAARRLVR